MFEIKVVAWDGSCRPIAHGQRCVAECLLETESCLSNIETACSRPVTQGYRSWSAMRPRFRWPWAPAPSHLRPMANGWYQDVSFEFSTRCARQGDGRSSRGNGLWACSRGTALSVKSGIFFLSLITWTGGRVDGKMRLSIKHSCFGSRNTRPAQPRPFRITQSTIADALRNSSTDRAGTSGKR